MQLRNTLLFILFALSAIDICAQRIVSLVPSVTHTMAQLGCDTMVVGRTSYCPKPVDGSSAIVGDVLSVSVEAIVALQPDAVVTMSFTSAATIDKMRSLGLNVVELRTPQTFSEICSQTLQLAALVGRETEAQQFIDTEKLKVDSISSLSKGRQGTAFFQIGTRPLFGVVADSFMNDLLTFAGLTNILTDGNGMCSREMVVSTNPNVLIMTTMGGLSVDEVAQWQRLVSSQIIVVDENKACCPTPLFFRQTLESITHQLDNQ